MRRVSQFKGAGYLVSSVSVILLAIVAFDGARKNGILVVCLALGALASIGGMALRWRSHRLEQAEKDELERKRD